MTSRLLHIIIIFLAALQSLLGQDVEAFAKKSNYNLRGGLSVGSQFYSALGDTEPRLSPFGYRVAGNVNAQLGAVNFPISFSFNHVDGSIAAPFNLYGASPYYKWIKLHLGHRALSFNPYTYSGTAFNGVGLSLTPGSFELTTFVGKIRNRYALRDTIIAGAVVLPSHDRNIQGLKIGVGKRSSNISLSAVRIKDANDPLITEIDPVENIALGLQGSVRLWRSIKIEANVASSIFTGNQIAPTPELTSEYEKQVREAITINATSRVAFAGDAFVGYDRRGVKVGIKYRRIDPFYSSLGTNYIQNDVQNYTIDGALPLLKRRLRLRGSLGFQNDNLQNQKAFTSRRIIGAVSASYVPSQKLSLQTRFSNYQHQNESGLVLVNDTLKILTTTQAISLSAMARIHDNDSYSSSVNVSAFRNNVVDEARVEGGNIFVGNGFNVRANLQLKESEFTISPFFNFNRFEYATFEQGRMGAGLTLTKSLHDQRWTTAFTFVLNQNTYVGKANGTLTNFNISSRYKIDGRHHLNFRLYYIDNDVIVTNSFREVRGNFTYGFTLR